MLYLSGIIITFFLSLLLISKKNKSLADKILAAWLICTGFHLTFFYIYTSGNYVSFPYFLGMEIGMPLLQGPFLFLYTIAITQSRKLTGRSLLHFLPFLVVLGLLTPFFSLPIADKIYVYEHEGVGYENLVTGVLIALSISGVLYIILSFLILRRHARRIEQEFSNTERINLNWLRYLIYGTGVIWIVILSGLHDLYIFGTVVLYMFFLGFFGIRQVGVFSSKALVAPGDNNPTAPELNKVLPDDLPVTIQELVVLPLSEAVTVEKNERTKYQNSSLNEAEGVKLYERLQLLMDRQQLYKSPELTLGDLAQELQLHPNVLSQVINTYAGKSFYDYINDLRIEEFKKMVGSPANKQYTFLALAFECGFNSKTAFNRNFKKATGLSPTQYIQQLPANGDPVTGME
jgi:AraC-like DNA-binding protein